METPGVILLIFTGALLIGFAPILVIWGAYIYRAGILARLKRYKATGAARRVLFVLFIWSALLAAAFIQAPN